MPGATRVWVRWSGRDFGGFAKFLWVVFVVALPYLGVFVDLIARGNKMGEHAMVAG